MLIKPIIRQKVGSGYLSIQIKEHSLELKYGFFEGILGNTLSISIHNTQIVLGTGISLVEISTPRHP